MIHIEDHYPHIVSEVICIKCGKRWIAVRPHDTYLKNLECPNCGKGYVIETGEVLKEMPKCLSCKYVKDNGKCKLLINDSDGCQYYSRKEV